MEGSWSQKKILEDRDGDEKFHKSQVSPQRIHLKEENFIRAII